MSSILGFTLGSSSYVGDLTEGFSAYIGGSSRKVDQETLHITHRLSAPSTAELYVRGFTPAEFSDVQLYNGGTGGYRLFGGTAIQVEYDAVRLGDDPWHRVSCQDYTWLINRYQRVNARYSDIGINTCLRQILAAYTDGGFTVGYCPASLGDLWDVRFSDASVTDAIEELARTAGGFWDVDADKRVHIFIDPDHLSTDSISLTNSSKNFARPTVTKDGSDVATRVYVLGASSATTAETTPAAVLLPVEDVTLFRGATAVAGTVLCNEMVLTYTGVSTTTGPGNLTGVSGITAHIPQGSEVQVRVMAEDASAQSDLATLLGGGLSGIAELTLTADADIDLATQIAAAELDKRKAVFKGMTYSAQDQVHTGASKAVKGQNVSVNITAPTTVSGTFRIQEVQIGVKPNGKLSGTTLGFERRVNLGPYFRGLNTARRLAKVH